MKLLVTGGAGFIGSALIRFIIEKTEHSVINLDKLTYAGNLESLPGCAGHPRYHFEKVDVCDASEVQRVLRAYQPDCIMHLAAESHVDRSIDAPATFMQTNVMGTFVLLQEARSYYARLSPERAAHFRLHHISTDEVFGDLGESGYFSETSAYDPSSPYSASKAASDHLVRAWGRTYKLPVVLSNCSNNYGPYQFPEKLIPLMVSNALQGKPLPIYGAGNQVRDWLYVDDHVSALMAVLERGQLGETYAIGGHNERENIQVVQALCNILDERVEQRPAGLASYSDLITHVADRPGHDQRYAIDASKIERDLGWKPAESFESGLAKTVDWYLNNVEWSQRVLDGSYCGQRLGTLTAGQSDQEPS